jgi:phage terminase large subunit-like protein
LPDGAWAACADPDLPLNPELPVGVGVVKAQHSDHAAVVIAQRQGDRVVVRCRTFSPESSTGRVSSEAMREHLREIRARYPVAMVRDQKTRRLIPGPAFAYDRVQFSENAEILEQEGLDMVETNQTAAVMAPPSTATYELITTGRVRHDGDRVLAEHMDNAVAVLTERGMKVALPKLQTSRRSHAAVALVMAVAMAMQDAPKAFKPKAVAGGF